MMSGRKTINTILNDSIYVNIEVRRSGINYPIMHSHNAYEIYILTSGSRTVFADKNIYLLGAGDAFTVKPGILHRSFGDGAYSGVCIEFSEKCLRDNFDPEEAKRILRCFEYPIVSIDEEAAKKIQGLCDDKREFVLRAVDILLKFAYAGAADEKQTMKSDLSPVGIYLQDHFTEQLTLSDIAKHFCITKEYLCSLFKSHTGITVFQYINLLRIQRAEVLLQETELSSAEISRLCGFSSPIYFNRVFKRIMEETPLSHRRRARETGMYSYEKS